MNITLFCTFLCRPCITRTYSDQILSLLENGNGKATNSTISVTTRERSLLLSSNPNSLLLSNWAPWINRQKSERIRSLLFSDVFMDVAVGRIVRSLMYAGLRPRSLNLNQEESFNFLKFRFHRHIM